MKRPTNSGNTEHGKKSKKKRKSRGKVESNSSESDEEKSTDDRSPGETNKKKLKTGDEIEADNGNKGDADGEVKEGNMIILQTSSDMWKTSSQNEKLNDESKSREIEFENYLEDLLL